jgi:hypothetical protein
MDIPSLTVDRVKEGLLARRFSAAQLAAEALRVAQAENTRANAFLHFSLERALAAARRVDEQIARGEDPGPLTAALGHACGRSFQAAGHLAKHPEFAWVKEILRDMPARPWTRFTAR